jgi:hypothetical protein
MRFSLKFITRSRPLRAGTADTALMSARRGSAIVRLPAPTTTGPAPGGPTAKSNASARGRWATTLPTTKNSKQARRHTQQGRCHLSTVIHELPAPGNGCGEQPNPRLSRSKLSLPRPVPCCPPPTPRPAPPTAPLAALRASSDPSVARTMVVGKMLMRSSFRRVPILRHDASRSALMQPFAGPSETGSGSRAVG